MGPRIVLSPEESSRLLVFLNISFYREGLLAPRPTTKLEDHPSSAVRDCLFNLFAGDRGGTVVKVLCYKSECHWFGPSWCQ